MTTRVVSSCGRTMMSSRTRSTSRTRSRQDFMSRLGGTQAGRMMEGLGALVEADVPGDPVDVALLGAVGVALRAESLADQIEELHGDPLRVESPDLFSGIVSAQLEPGEGVVSRAGQRSGPCSRIEGSPSGVRESCPLCRQFYFFYLQKAEYSTEIQLCSELHACQSQVPKGEGNRRKPTGPLATWKWRVVRRKVFAGAPRLDKLSASEVRQ
jgi:hypothetical protein